LFLADIYAAGEKPVPGLDSDKLARAIHDHGHHAVRYVKDRAVMASEIARIAQPGDVVIALGAGDINKILASVAAELQARDGKANRP
jgi:UDP-N-acetylmuramate--alanine ligase